MNEQEAANARQMLADLTAFAKRQGASVALMELFVPSASDLVAVTLRSAMPDSPQFTDAEVMVIGRDSWAKGSSVKLDDEEWLSFAIKFDEGLLRLSVELNRALLAEAIPVATGQYVFRTTSQLQELCDRGAVLDRLLQVVNQAVEMASFSLDDLAT
jgi:hypothetical protein